MNILKGALVTADRIVTVSEVGHASQPASHLCICYTKHSLATLYLCNMALRTALCCGVALTSSSVREGVDDVKTAMCKWHCTLHCT